MLLYLSATEYDPIGFVEIAPTRSTKPGESRRRVNRIATLDGSSVVNDFGFTESDRTVVLKWEAPSAAYEENIVRMVRSYRELNIALRDGVFVATPDTYVPPSGSDAESSLTLLVTRKLSA